MTGVHADPQPKYNAGSIANNINIFSHQLTFLDKQRERRSGGRLLVSVELLPKATADAVPAGKGREAPQALPKPTGALAIQQHKCVFLVRVRVRA